SSINVSAKGKSRSTSAHRYVGGSYGGRVGLYGSYESVEEFGRYTSPVDYGIGGNAGRGGGAVELTAGELQLDGHILANGSSVSSNGGAGSGGSVWLRVNTLSGTGAISADGGNGRSGYYGSGGGGGRIAVYYTQNEGFELSNITSTGGLGGYRTESAGAGT